MRIRRAEPRLAGQQAEWIVTLEPWRSLGYRAAPLARYLRKMARQKQLLVAEEGRTVRGLVAFQPDFLLGHFVALLVVRPDAAGKGMGRALVSRVEEQAFKHRRWLYVSSDSQNRDAARFYRKLDFARVARLPGLIREDRVEILWRKRRPS
jgi:ribosomal protein S18 acetylase RimI-like enzyme